MAVSGDTVVASAHQEASNATGVNGNESDNSAPGSGAAYVFVRSGTNWSQQAYLKASNTGTNDNFGGGFNVGQAGVSIWGETVVVGANLEDSNARGVNSNQVNNSASDSGTAYVFTGLGPVPPQLALVPSGNSITLPWPTSATGFLLQSATTLTNGGNWQDSNLTPTETNGQNVVMVDTTNTAGFFRLRGP